MIVHTLFDALAWLAAAAVALLLRRVHPELFVQRGKMRPGYTASLVAGAALGAYALGSLNLWLAGQWGFARSIEGALLGGIVGVELYKFVRGITERTGMPYALPLAVGIAIGRIGCFFAGLDDFTYGVPTSLPWAHDFGDGVPRHPVQLYESLSMAGFAAAYLVALRRGIRPIVANGFYLAVLVYAAQRFVWEFLKPYPPALFGLTVFQLACLVLAAYALLMLRPSERSHAAAV